LFEFGGRRFTCGYKRLSGQEEGLNHEIYKMQDLWSENSWR